MSSSIQGTSIRLTRGDTFRTQVIIRDKETGDEYEMQEGDTLRFRCVKSAGASEELIEKPIDASTLVLDLAPSDTSNLKFGDYFYDIELTKANGDVDTVIAEARITIAPEADPIGG